MSEDNLLEHAYIQHTTLVSLAFVLVTTAPLLQYTTSTYIDQDSNIVGVKNIAALKRKEKHVLRVLEDTLSRSTCC